MKKDLLTKIVIVLLAIVLIGATYLLVTTYNNYLDIKETLASDSNEEDDADLDDNIDNEQEQNNTNMNESENDLELDNNVDNTEENDPDLEQNSSVDDENNDIDQEVINDNEDNNIDEENDNSQNQEIENTDPIIVEAKSAYLSGYSTSKESVLDELIRMANTTELNSVVIDIKEGGVVNYTTKVPEVLENGLYSSLYDPSYVVNKLKENGIYVIGRIVCFKDDGYARAYPQRAIKTPQGTILSSDKSAWANPYIEANWDYNIDIALEAIEYGFDEIQFDYVRFPSASSSQVDYGEADAVEYSRAQAIKDFLEKAYQKIHTEKGVNLSADVFAIACISDLDARIIGQRVDWVSQHVDYICPMIYPSHYANSSNGIMGNGVGQGINGTHFTKPDLKPYEVVYETLMAMSKKMEDKEGVIAKVRPYLQDFTAAYLREGYYQSYEKEELRAQIQAVYDAGYSEWILWDGGGGKYTKEAFLPLEQ